MADYVIRGEQRRWVKQCGWDRWWMLTLESHILQKKFHSTLVLWFHTEMWSQGSVKSSNFLKEAPNPDCYMILHWRRKLPNSQHMFLSHWNTFWPWGTSLQSDLKLAGVFIYSCGSSLVESNALSLQSKSQNWCTCCYQNFILRYKGNRHT